MITFQDLDRFAIPVDIDSKEDDAKAMRKKLRGFGLETVRINVIIHRIVYNWTFSEIAKKFNIPHTATAFRIYKKGLELLKERKYK